MKLQSPEDLLVEELRDIHSAERQLQRAMPRLVRMVETEGLQDAMQTRLEQGQRLIEDLDDALEELGAGKGRRKNVAAEGLLENAAELVDDIQEPLLRDAALTGAIQKLEHYCIAAWGTSRSIAQSLGKQSVVECMERVLEQGKQQDEELTRLAETEIYPALMDGGTQQSEGGEGRSRSQSGGQSSGGSTRRSSAGASRKDDERTSASGSSSQGGKQGGGGQQGGR